jgi:hypothetical protein
MVKPMNTSEIESAIEHAINALSLAKLALSKSALSVFNDRDVLRKADLDPPRAGEDDVAKRGLEMLANAERRIERLEAQRDLDAQTPRKTYRDTAAN